MMKHRFITDAVGAATILNKYVCVCGVHGTYAVVERHIAEENEASTDVGADFGGETKAFYQPNEPRPPAAIVPSALEQTSDRTSAPDLPPPPPIPSRTRSIAEEFQDMLRQAFTAGLAAAQTHETFETWYQREVLQ